MRALASSSLIPRPFNLVSTSPVMAVAAILVNNALVGDASSGNSEESCFRRKLTTEEHAVIVENTFPTLFLIIIVSLHIILSSVTWIRRSNKKGKRRVVRGAGPTDLGFINHGGC